MRVLWITNILFPEAISKISSCEATSGGGWMLGAAESLIQHNNILLCVATVSNLVKELKRIEGEKILYYVLPYGKGNGKVNPDYEKYWKQIRAEYKPDVVHIHGTEFSHGLAYVNACGPQRVVVSIQGLTSAYYYYYYGISTFQLFRNITIRDFLKGNTVSGQRLFKRRGEFEKELLSIVSHIIGRTSWDRARTWAINPNAKYYICNETLRDVFYEGKWSYENCEKYSIFVSGGSAPLKGLHMLLRAMPLVLRHYPDTKIRIAGGDVTRRSGNWKERIKLSDYGNIIRKLIDSNNLRDKVFFTGSLNALQMKNEFLRSNIFVLPSSIENSPNSLGEAQILGVPCISSYVGGTMDMIPNPACGELYRFEEIEMLAYKICNLFAVSENYDNSLEIKEAENRHSRLNNALTLISIYKSIIEE